MLPFPEGCTEKRGEQGREDEERGSGGRRERREGEQGREGEGRGMEEEGQKRGGVEGG